MGWLKDMVKPALKLGVSVAGAGAAFGSQLTNSIFGTRRGERSERLLAGHQHYAASPHASARCATYRDYTAVAMDTAYARGMFDAYRSFRTAAFRYGDRCQ